MAAKIDTNSKERPSDIYIFSDQDSDPLKTDINPAHFDGFLLELAEGLRQCQGDGAYTFHVARQSHSHSLTNGR